MRDVRDALYVARNSDGKLVRRPKSPHLDIYRWPLSMALSICHRISGCGLGFGALLLLWWLVAAATSDRAFAFVQWFLATPIGLLALFGFTVCLTYHLSTGIRHLWMDLGKGYEKAEYKTTGLAVLGGTVSMTALVWIVGLLAR